MQTSNWQTIPLRIPAGRNQQSSSENIARAIFRKFPKAQHVNNRSSRRFFSLLFFLWTLDSEKTPIFFFTESYFISSGKSFYSNTFVITFRRGAHHGKNPFCDARPFSSGFAWQLFGESSVRKTYFLSRRSLAKRKSLKQDFVRFFESELKSTSGGGRTSEHCLIRESVGSSGENFPTDWRPHRSICELGTFRYFFLQGIDRDKVLRNQV